MRAAMAALREEGGAGACSRSNVSESHGILSLKIPCRFQPVSEFVFGTYDAAFVQAMYEDYLRDPISVGPEWRELFENGRLAELPVIPAERAPSAVSRTPESAATPRLPAHGAPLTAHAVPANAVPITGPAARLVQNMTESLTVPTATSFRDIPATTLDARRKALNSQLAASGKKVSFTHLIGYGIVQAAKRFPIMTHHFQDVDGKPYRVDPGAIGLGLAVDVEKKDGSRALVVPVIKHAETMDFAAFHAAYEALVEKARTNRLMPDDFAGGTIQLTNRCTHVSRFSCPVSRRSQIRGGGLRPRSSAPQLRPPRRPSRPARQRAARRSVARPRPSGTHAGHHGAHPGGSAAHLRARADAHRGAAESARDLLRHDRLRSRTHRQPRGATLAAARDRIGAASPAAVGRREEAAAVASHRRRRARALPAQGLPWPEAVFDRRPGHDRADARLHDRAGRRASDAYDDHRDGAPRPMRGGQLDREV